MGENPSFKNCIVGLARRFVHKKRNLSKTTSVKTLQETSVPWTLWTQIYEGFYYTEFQALVEFPTLDETT